jgi:hypothetical protein
MRYFLIILLLVVSLHQFSYAQITQKEFDDLIQYDKEIFFAISNKFHSKCGSSVFFSPIFLDWFSSIKNVVDAVEEHVDKKEAYAYIDTMQGKSIYVLNKTKNKGNIKAYKKCFFLECAYYPIIFDSTSNKVLLLKRIHIIDKFEKINRRFGYIHTTDHLAVYYFELVNGTKEWILEKYINISPSFYEVNRIKN